MTVSIHPSGSYTGVSYKASIETSIHNLLNSASCTLHAPLKSNLFLSRGTGAATWSRATAAWRFNELGYLEQIATGGAVFLGPRLVRNWCSPNANTEDVSVAGWLKTNVTITGQDTVVCSAGTSYQRVHITAGFGTRAIGEKFRISARLTYVDHPFVQVALFGVNPRYVNFDLVNGTYAVDSSKTVVASITAVSAGVWDIVAIIPISLTSANPYYCIFSFCSNLASSQAENFTGDGVKSFKITRISVVDITNYPSTYNPEYVSVGVLSSPWHGGGADGVKYFETDYNGNIIPDNDLLGFRREVAATNNLLWSRDLAGGLYSSLNTYTPKAWIPTTYGSELVTNGTFDVDLTNWTQIGSGSSSWVAGAMRVDCTAGSGGRYQDITCTIGTTYLITADTTMVSGTGGSFCRIYTDASTTTIMKYQFSSTTASFAIIFTATNTTHRLYLQGASGQVADWDNISVKTCMLNIQKTAFGLDNFLDPTATTLTAVTDDATIFQPVTLTSAARCSSAYIKRKTGTGTISFTQDGGSTWTDITSQINNSTWTRVQITSTLTNPVVGFKITTSGDEVEVDCVQLESGAIATSPIVTTTAAVTRNTDSLTYPTASNIDFTVGSVFLETMHQGSLINTETAFGTTVAILYRSNTTPVTSYRVYDGTNIVQKDSLSDVSTGVRKRAASWGTSLKVCGDGASPTFGSFDGSLPSDVSFGVGSTSAGSAVLNGTVKNVSIFNYEFSDSELQGITS